jgi:hypothetical protein
MRMQARKMQNDVRRQEGEGIVGPTCEKKEEEEEEEEAGEETEEADLRWEVWCKCA